MSARMLAAVCLSLALVGASPRGPAAATEAPLAVELAPGSWISLAGTSTLHPFTSRTTRFSVSATRDGDAPDPADALGMVQLADAPLVRGVTVDIPVRTLLSGEGGLDRNLWKALKSEEHPQIVYRLTGYSPAPTAAPSDTVRVRVTGTLEVAGVARPMPLEVAIRRDGGGVVLEGTSALLMSEFGVKPPRLMLGALRVGDRIVVQYHLRVVPSAPGLAQHGPAGTKVGQP